MKLYCMRHGETEYNKVRRITGQTDIPLIEEGLQQAEEAAAHLPSGISAIYSSDLIRCKQTTDILNKKLNLPVTYDARLRERDFGSFTGKLWQEIDPDSSLQTGDKLLKFDYRPQGGESTADMHARVFACIDDMRIAHKGENILVVTSAGVIRVLHHFLNKELHERIGNSSIHEFEFED